MIVILNDRQIRFNIFNWLPRHRCFLTDRIGSYPPTREFGLLDQHINKDLLGVLRNPNYERFQQYGGLRCAEERHWSIFLWAGKTNYKNVEANNKKRINSAHFYNALYVKYPDAKLFEFGEGQTRYDYYYFDDEGNFTFDFSDVNKTMSFIKQQDKQVIHINIEWKEKLFERYPGPFANGHMINITLDNVLPTSPVFENGRFILWEMDLSNPLFIEKLMERITSIMCSHEDKQEL